MPISLTVLAVILLLIYIKESIMEKHIYKFKLIFSSLLIFLFIIPIILNDAIRENETLLKAFDYVYLACFIGLGVIYYFTVTISIEKKNVHLEFLEYIQEKRFYVLLDKKDKIREISNSFASELGFQPKSLKGYYFKTVFDSKYTIEMINDEPFTNEDLYKSFKEMKFLSSKNKKDIKRELRLYDNKNKPQVLNFIDHPIFLNDSYEGHILIGDSRSDNQVLNVEKKLSERNDELDLIRERFAAELDISDESKFFLNLEEKYYWVNDSLKDLLNLPSNSISADEYYDSIFKDDLPYYMKTIASLTPHNSEYESTYRIRTGSMYIYVKEKGKKIFLPGKNEIIGYIKEVKTNHYAKSDIPELDNLDSDKELNVALHKLYEENRYFQLVKFELTNLPEINEVHGRDIGNMTLAEYIKAINKAFVEDKMIYRVSGLLFAFIIVDPRKMALLKKGLESGSILHPHMQYGNLNIDVKAHMGVASSRTVPNEKAILECANKALKFSLYDNVETDYCYYDDIA